MPLRLDPTQQIVNVHWAGEKIFVYAASDYSSPKWQTIVGTSSDGKEWKFYSSDSIGSLTSAGCGLYTAIHARIGSKDYIIAGGFGTSTLTDDHGNPVVLTSPVLAKSADKGKTWVDLKLPILKAELDPGPLNYGECTGVGYDLKTKKIYAVAVYLTAVKPEGLSELQLTLYEGSIDEDSTDGGGGFAETARKIFTQASLISDPPPAPPWPDGAVVNDRTISVRPTPDRDYLFYSGTDATYASSNGPNQRVEEDNLHVDLGDNPTPYISGTVGKSLILHVDEDGKIVGGDEVSPPIESSDFESEYVMGTGFFQGVHYAATISYA